MDVGIALNRFPSLSETFILDQITGLIDMGQNVTIISRMRGNDEITHDVVSEYNLQSRTIQCSVPFGKSKFRQSAGAIRLLAKNAPKAPRHYFRLLSDSIVKPTEVGEELFLTPAYSDSEFDVVNSHFGVINNRVADLKSHGFINCPLIATFHGRGIRVGNRQGGEIYEGLFDQANLILANSQKTLDELHKFGAPKSITKIHPIGVDLSKFPYDGSTDPEKNEPIVVLSVGRLVQEKGHATGIRSFAEVVTANPDIDLEYRIVGDGPLREELRDLAVSLDVGSDVELVGSVDLESVVKEMENADIFFHPSSSEGFGKVLLEAQAIGLPIVASNVGGISDAVDDGNSAFLTDGSNPEVMSNVLEELILNPDSWADMSLKGREYVEKNYDIVKLNRKLLRMYRDVVAKY